MSGGIPTKGQMAAKEGGNKRGGGRTANSHCLNLQVLGRKGEGEGVTGGSIAGRKGEGG